MDAVLHSSPEVQVTKYSAGSLPAECMSFSLVSLENRGGRSPVVDCWQGVGNFINCRSTQSLTQKYGTMNILNSAEKFAVTASEKNSFFYQDPHTGLNIESPAKIVIEQGEARTEFGASNRCRVYNDAYGSKGTAGGTAGDTWINRFQNGNKICGKGDWTCIYEAVRAECARFENDPNCHLTEEFIDGIPTTQFGNNTNFVGQREGTCWILNYTPLPANDPSLQPPDLSGTPFANLQLHLNEDQTNHGAWWRCGDFNILDRRYICDEDRIVDTDIARNEVINTNNLQAAIAAKNAKQDVEFSTGNFRSYTFKDQTVAPMDSDHQGITLGSDSEANADCPAREQSCVVTWKASDLIYGDARTRQNISPIDPASNLPQAAPQGITTKKQLRKCELDATGNPTCPHDVAIETVVSNCACQNLLGEAVGTLAMIRTLSNDIKCTNADGQSQYTDAYMQKVSELRQKNCGESPGQSVGYFCGVVNETVASNYQAQCTDFFHRRSQLESLQIRPGNILQRLPLKPIQAILSTDDSYQCTLTWVDDTSVSISPGPIVPQVPWFDICYTSFVDSAETYIKTHDQANYRRLPGSLCNPNLPVGTYVGSRPNGGCGFDKWSITDGPNRVNLVGLDPFSNWPFGIVEMGFTVSREFDTDKANTIDCNNDNWLDCFSCVHRDAGFDCNKDCLADNNEMFCTHLVGFDCSADGKDRAEYANCAARAAGQDCDNNCLADNNAALCPHISGYDCNGDQAVDYNLCNLRIAGRDCSGDLIADNDISFCPLISGWDCDGNGTPDHGSCTARSAGYDYDGDCISDSPNSPIESAKYCGTTKVCDKNGENCVDNPKTCAGVAVSAGWDCFGTACSDFAVCSWVSGRDCNGDGFIDNNPNFCPWVNGGFDCFGNASADPGCGYIDGYDCGQNGGAAGNFSPDGKIDNNTNYCPFVSAGFDCFGSACADANCKAIDGYDCGTNGGAQSNQAPDGTIDNNINYCAHVEAGYDCSGGNCDGNHPSYNGFSNNGIDGGACNTPANLADLECKVGNWRCSRFDEPGKCGVEARGITLKIPIQNNGGNDYDCRLLDPDVGMFEVSTFGYPNEARFLPEGCQGAINNVYFKDTLSVTNMPVNLGFEYIAYEDLIDKVARNNNRCEWRDPATISSCTNPDPFHNIGKTDYVYVENKSNPTIEIVAAPVP
ncbi:MAG: hypothetical protein V1852_16090 [Pseudomonadota bacterium]